MPTDEPIYDFHLTKAALKRRGIDVEFTGGYTVVRPTDVVFKNGRGNVEFENDEGEQGIFIKDSNGHYRQVFMYKRDYHLYKYGTPKFHICKCKTIQEFIDFGGFRDHYRFANTEEVPVINWDNFDKEEIVSNLDLCYNCYLEMQGQYDSDMTSDDFVEILKEAGEADPDEEAKEVDIFGYVKDWQKISEAKRKLEDYTCEICGFKAENSFDKFYMHVHHKDGNKLNNNPKNLQCLCIRCHANIDEKHRKNFSEGDKKIQLEDFNERHKQCVQYIRRWKLFDYCEEKIGKRSCTLKVSNNKIVAVAIGNDIIFLDKSMGDIENTEIGKRQINYNSFIVKKPDDTLRIYPTSGVEYKQVEKTDYPFKGFDLPF